MNDTGREVDQQNLEYILTHYPSVVVFDDERLIGFTKTKPFAPDILELENIFITKQCRNANIGGEVLKSIEAQMEKTPYKAIILTNSNLYKNNDDKRDASSFYIKNNYKEIASTHSTRIFYKEIS